MNAASARQINGRDERRGEEEKGEIEKQDKKDKKEKKEKSKMVTTGEMIIVNVNDRLGTKAAIPCLASDPISKFPLPPLVFSPYSPPFPPFSPSLPPYIPYPQTNRPSPLSHRTLQSPSSSPHRPRAPRNHVKAARRAALQGPVDARRLWGQ